MPPVAELLKERVLPEQMAPPLLIAVIEGDGLTDKLIAAVLLHPKRFVPVIV